MAKRTDIHAPGSEDFNPEDYQYRGVFDTNPGADSISPEYVKFMLAQIEAAVDKAKAAGYSFAPHQCGKGKCGHCGAYMRYAALMAHKPSMELIWVGEICLDNTFESTREEFRAIRKAANAQRKLSKQIGVVNRRLLQAAERQPILAVWQDSEDWARVARRYPAFVRDIYNQVNWKDLTDRQCEAAANAIAQSDAKRAEVKAAVESGKQERCPIGRLTILGTVLSRKEVEAFDGGTAIKLLVQSDKGWKVYVTAPSAIRWHVKKGDRVKFAAAVTPSEDDPIFGFASRPTKAEILPSVA